MHPNSLAAIKEHQFKKGENNNPKGRPPSLGPRIRAKFGDGDEIIQYLHDVATGKIKPHRERNEAIKIAIERGWGKTPDINMNIDATSEAKSAAEELSADQLLELIKSTG